MVRVMLEGVHVHRKKLANGETREYHYAWRGAGAPRLKGKPGSPEYIKSYNDAHAERQRHTPSEDTIAGLSMLYQQSAEFDALKRSTRDENARQLKRIVAKFGSMKTIAVEAKGSRRVFKRWRDSMKATPRTADKHWAMLRSLFEWAIDQEIITRNPCLRGGKLAKSTRREIVWSNAQITKFMLAAPDNLQLAMLLALWTSQRQGDLLSFQWSQYDGTHIRLTQQKTGRRVCILVASELKVALDRAPRTSTRVLLSANGTPWASRHSFKRAWTRVCERAEIEGVTFHDLRGTALTRIVVDANPTSLELASISGHSPQSADRVLDEHYIAPAQGVGDDVIRRLEKNQKRTRGVERL